MSANNDMETEVNTNNQLQELDSKYRMIIVAAQRSKQLQRGARPRIELDSQRRKPTRVALEEIQQGKVSYRLVEKK